MIYGGSGRYLALFTCPVYVYDTHDLSNAMGKLCSKHRCFSLKVSLCNVGRRERDIAVFAIFTC